MLTEGTMLTDVVLTEGTVLTDVVLTEGTVLTDIVLTERHCVDVVLTEGSGNGGSILSQSGMGSNAVVDGNGYIVYLNRDDSTDFHSPAIPFVPPDNTLSNTGNTRQHPLQHR